MSDRRELIIYANGQLALDVTVTPEKDTVWLTQEQMSILFDTARSSIAYHIGNIFKEGELERDTSVEFFDRSDGKASRPPAYYNLDVIISVGYRVKSNRGVEFRCWANNVLKQYILKGYAVNEARIQQLGSVIRLMKRVEDDIDAKQVLSVIERYNTALDLLDDYDQRYYELFASITVILQVKEFQTTIQWQGRETGSVFMSIARGFPFRSR